MKNILYLIVLFLFIHQIDVNSCAEAEVIDSTFLEKKIDKKTLSFNVHTLAFFKDNEFDGVISKGYTLPGFIIEPQLQIKLSDKININLGLHSLIYYGANKYPNYAFHDIPYWKGEQYQKGAHTLPLFRAEIKSRNMQFLLGTTYRIDNHNLILPLYNPETIISTDPEQGAQLKVNKPYWNVDLWIDWQSFIFEQDTHQETFTLGLSQQFKIFKNKLFSASIPLQVIVQHRGGEQDIPSLNLGVQTLCNAAIGVKTKWNMSSSKLNNIIYELNTISSYQQAGHLWKNKSGIGLWSSITMKFINHLEPQLGFFYSKSFISLYGSPFFSILSQKYADSYFTSLKTIYWGIKYSLPIKGNCEFGVKANGFLTLQGNLNKNYNIIERKRVGNAFSFLFYINVNPIFNLWSKQ